MVQSQRPGDGLNHAIQFVINLDVHESQQANPKCFDVTLPLGIISLCFRGEMGVPIHFNRQFGLDALEVDAIRSDAVLAAKPVPAQLASTQARPQLRLGWGQLVAETAPQVFLGEIG